MQHLMFEFESQAAMEEAAKRLWEHHGVSGEMSARPLPGGRWRLEIHAEKELRTNTLEKYDQFRVEPGSD